MGLKEIEPKKQKSELKSLSSKCSQSALTSPVCSMYLFHSLFAKWLPNSHALPMARYGYFSPNYHDLSASNTYSFLHETCISQFPKYKFFK